jgi:hypothetical protein
LVFFFGFCVVRARVLSAKPWHTILQKNKHQTLRHTKQPPPPHGKKQVAVPLAAAGDCLAALSREMYDGPRPAYQGFRTPLLLRFVAGVCVWVGFFRRGGGLLRDERGGAQTLLLAAPS